MLLIFRYFKLGTWALILVAFGTKALSQENILRFEHITNKNGLPQNSIMATVKDKYGFIWFATWDGLCRYDGYKTVTYRYVDNNPRSIPNNRVIMLHKDKYGNIWIHNIDTTYARYNYETDDFTRYKASQLPDLIKDSLDRFKNISFCYIEHYPYLWQVNMMNNKQTVRRKINYIDNKLFQTNLITQKIHTFNVDPLNPWGINDDYVFSIYLDNSDILWVGTYSGGVNKADLKQKQFFHYSHRENDKNSLIDNKIRAFCLDNHGDLWIGTHSRGITRLDRKNEKYTHYQFDSLNVNGSLINNEIRKLYKDRFGYIWVATKMSLDRIDPRTNTHKHYHLPVTTPITYSWVYDITEDHNGYLWIATWGGIGKFNRKKDKFELYAPKPLFKRMNTRFIFEDSRYNLWVGTEGGGLTKLKRDSSNGFVEKLTPQHYICNPNDSNSLSSNHIYVVEEDEKGILWIGTNEGLTRFDPVNNKFKRFNVKNGLLSEVVRGVISDKKGHIWFSHTKGLSRMNTQTFEIRNYSPSDGLQNEDFSEGAFFRNPQNGEMFFGGVNGFNCFFPDSIGDNPYPPQLVITNLYVSRTLVKPNIPINGHVILTRPMYLTKKITLTNNEPIFSLEIAALHYSDPINNHYAYKLEGLDTTWNYFDAKNRLINFAGLKPGIYTLKVKASNCDDVWVKEPLSLTIEILAPWWASWWFRISLVILILLLFASIFYLRTALYRKRQNELSKMVDARTNELLEANTQLIERQKRIQEQAAELEEQRNGLQDSNQLLLEKQNLIQQQSQELEDTNNQLKVLNSTKDRLFSIIAHDLRNPFHVVTGFSEILLRDFKRLSPEKIDKYLSLVLSSSRAGNELLENLLQWSRSQTGRIQYDPERIVLATVIEEVISFYEGAAERKQINIEQMVSSDVIVWADENMLKTIFRNIISNAIKFTPERGHIIIDSTLRSKNCEIMVSDTGVGISPTNLKLLFRIDAILTTKGTLSESGTGLGLILCKEFVEKQNGKIWVESELGQGSRFYFTIPMA